MDELDQFDGFERSLTQLEKDSIHAWQGVWHGSIQEFQRTGKGDEITRTHEMHLSRALQKAVVCSARVFRGLSAGAWRPETMASLRHLIDGPIDSVLCCHESASQCRAMGLSFAQVGPDDEERDLAVLLTVLPCTARHLRPFRHAYKDEEEVVLLRGSKYRRTRAERMPNPRPHLELWEVDWLEIA